jgi:2-methylisocitrate lyase-like PEP mutase family enzyme
MSQQDRAVHFRRLHGQRPLVLPNAWDPASAREIARAGAAAIATTSAAVSWVHGVGDGERLDRATAMLAVRRIASAVTVPVTADIESGYGAGSPDDVAETARAVLAAGVVGINLEDSAGGALLPPERQAERLRAARSAARAVGIDLVINARTDLYLLAAGPEEKRLEETIRRGRAYRGAGADCVFVPGVVDRETVAALVRGIGGVINVMAGPGAPPIAELGALGVARVSVGPAIAQAALATVRRAARELLQLGTYRSLEDAVPFAEANAGGPAQGGSTP